MKSRLLGLDQAETPAEGQIKILSINSTGIQNVLQMYLVP